MAIDEAIYRETGEALRRFVKLAAVYSVMAAVLALGIPHAYTMTGSGYSRSTMGRVVAVEKLGGEERRLVTIEFPDDEGKVRRTREGERSGDNLRLGDTVPVVFNPDDDVARSINWGERALRASFIWMSLSLVFLGLVAIAVGLAQRRSRRWLLKHGRVEIGKDPRVTWHTIAQLPQLPPTWRLRAAWFDAESVSWRSVASARQNAAEWQPVPDALLLHIYVDPRRPRRAWLPTAHHRVPTPKD